MKLIFLSQVMLIFTLDHRCQRRWAVAAPGVKELGGPPKADCARRPIYKEPAFLQ